MSIPGWGTCTISFNTPPVRSDLEYPHFAIWGTWGTGLCKLAWGHTAIKVVSLEIPSETKSLSARWPKPSQLQCCKAFMEAWTHSFIQCLNPYSLLRSLSPDFPGGASGKRICLPMQSTKRYRLDPWMGRPPGGWKMTAHFGISSWKVLWAEQTGRLHTVHGAVKGWMWLSLHMLSSPPSTFQLRSFHYYQHF